MFTEINKIKPQLDMHGESRTLTGVFQKQIDFDNSAQFNFIIQIKNISYKSKI